ncbi:hypothetical protein INT43_005200 [Umbelopsis isabellina]|uniref:Exonuclease domain-containing protein n=1 Tax=Mortierella isabellina TaxID=91625 RepID=A0A8H7U8U4_MORIS|nr:hypothetical protein INT43_005200 [Umbelopsis isabellina]
MTCTLGTSNLFAYSEQKPSDKTFHDSSIVNTPDAYYTRIFEPDQSEAQVNRKTQPHKRRRNRKKDKLVLAYGSILISVNKLNQPVTFNSNGFKERLAIKDLRQFLLSCLADGVKPSWIHLKSGHQIRKFVVVHVLGFDSSCFDLPYDSNDFIKIDDMIKPCSFIDYMPFATELFGEVIALKSTKELNVVDEFCQCPLSNAERQRRATARRAKTKSAMQFTLEDCTLTLDEMLEAGYPIHSKLLGHSNLPTSWVQTSQRQPRIGDLTAEGENVIAIDCEMCLTGRGLELARVSLIDYASNVILDEMVQPSHPVVDYMTQYSGIRQANLEGVTTTLSDIQNRLLDIIDEDTILIGHSLQCDLNTLKLAHPRVIDTSRLYHHRNGPPPLRPSLKHLAARYLDRNIQSYGSTIQSGAELGHDPREDALASLDLVKLKLSRGPEFGLYISNAESIFSRLERRRPPRYGAILSSNLSSRPSIYTQQAQLLRQCGDDEQLFNHLLNEVGSYDFIWASFENITPSKQDIPPYINHSESPPKSGHQYTLSSSKHHGLATLDQRLQVLYNYLPTGTVLVVVGTADAKEQHRQVISNSICSNATCLTNTYYLFTLKNNSTPPLTPTSDSPEVDLKQPFKRTNVCLMKVK